MNYLRRVLMEQQSERERYYRRQRQIATSAWLIFAATCIAVGGLLWIG